ncbi:hypothetical protein [Acinetobacter sp. YH01020]|uniref:hypothetical protein n=1 Tax=Acinetobacter sp. YH01020 TaxID=2601034 RepID=UPI0015D33D32|nr:hypothetical protein [Acinetobacter sp. YH01020]
MGSKPKVVQQDPEADAQKAAEKATAEANAKRAGRRTANSDNRSLLGSKAETKTTLGGG